MTVSELIVVCYDHSTVNTAFCRVVSGVVGDGGEGEGERGEGEGEGEKERRRRRRKREKVFGNSIYLRQLVVKWATKIYAFIVLVGKFLYWHRAQKWDKKNKVNYFGSWTLLLLFMI